MTTIDSENILPNISPDELNDFLGEYTWEGKWENVIMLYYELPEQAQTAIISDSAGTALHVAIDLDEENVVKELVNAILTHNVEISDERVEALEMENERGDTPLHLAASRGFARICKCIIGSNNERIYLLSHKNKHGETPLFQAAINWRKQTFAYLIHISKHIVTLRDLIRDDGDSILHTAIQGEYFDLAVIVAYYYDFLSTHLNKEESTPLKLLANKPSAFKSCSYSNLPWYKRIVYNYVLVEPLDAEKTVSRELRKMEKRRPDPVSNKFPENYDTLCDFISNLFGKKVSKKKQHDIEDPFNHKRRPDGFLPPNYETFYQLVRNVYESTLGILGVELKDIKIAKNKHLWSSQLLKALMRRRPHGAFTGSDCRPTDREIDPDIYNVSPHFEQGGIGIFVEEQEQESDENEIETETKSEYEKEVVDKKMTPFLVAAKNGIVEMVNEILNEIPSAIHGTNSNKENVLLVAVKSRQPLIVETLRMRMIKHSKPELWNSLILAMDKRKNTILHLAAEALGDDKPGQIAGSAFQMMWDIKWFQASYSARRKRRKYIGVNTMVPMKFGWYIKSLVPQHFYFISNKKRRTSGEIFKKSHKDLIEDSNEWLKKTSESCSVVAVLVAGASFTAASAVPGGTTEGRPILEGNPAFDVFAFVSLIGLCFSVTALIMFLSIITSQKQAKDFRRDLPLKLFLGLSSLFVSIASMFVSFCTGHFFLLSHRFKSILFPIYTAACLPVAFYGVAQLPLYFYLLTTIFSKLPMATDNRDNY